MNNNDNNSFNYSYSAKEQEELKRLREKYAMEKKQESKLDRLRRLDRMAGDKAKIVSLVLGILGALILGFGMSIIMTDIGTAMGLAGAAQIAVGCILGIVGGGICALAYPVYNLVLSREQNRIAPEIIKLTDELLK